MPGPQVYGRCLPTRGASGDAAPYKAAIPDSIINNLPHLLQVFYLLYVAKAV